MTSADADIAPAADVLRLLADPVRARLVELLADEQLCVCHLVSELRTTQPNVSNHLRLLRAAGLVESEPAGRFTYYRLRPDALGTVSRHLADLAERAASPAPRRAC